MRSSHTITLFSERPELVQRPSSFLFSIVAHGGLAALIAFGAFSPPRISQLPKQRLVVRHLDLQAPEPLKLQSAGSKVGYPGPKSTAGTPQLEGSPVARQETAAKTGSQTLLQPDVSSPITLPDQMRLPSMFIWSKQKTVVKTIVPPPPEKPVAAEVKPSPEPPNQETNLADVRIAASELSTLKLPVLPSNTSPVVVHGPDLLQKIPATAAVSSAQPTPTAVLSLSDLRMTSGTVYLPPGNISASTTSPGGLTPGQGKDTSQPGNGNPGSNRGTGEGQGAGSSQPGNGNSAGNGTGNGNSAGNGGGKGSGAGGPNSGSAQGSDTGSGAGNQFGTTHIRLAKDGQFGAVAVGSMLEEKYPDLPSIWAGRLVYTVYLHVGLARSWILQYSLPPSSNATSAGNGSRIEAPWPYNIVRPDIPAAAIDADVLMIHGFVNKDGRFEALTVVFPPRFAQAEFLLDALKQWEFRPATQDGQAATVEVALIVPEETE
jgi:hypothetical protein